MTWAFDDAELTSPEQRALCAKCAAALLCVTARTGGPAPVPIRCSMCETVSGFGLERVAIDVGVSKGKPWAQGQLRIEDKFFGEEACEIGQALHDCKHVTGALVSPCYGCLAGDLKFDES